MTTTTTGTTGTGVARRVASTLTVPDVGTSAGTDDAWITAHVRPAGSFGREDLGRLRALLDALSACASLVVLDLRAVHLRTDRAAVVIDAAGERLEQRGGCLLCVGGDDECRARLAGCRHAVVVAPEEPVPVGAGS